MEKPCVAVPINSHCLGGSSFPSLQIALQQRQSRYQALPTRHLPSTLLPLLTAQILSSLLPCSCCGGSSIHIWRVFYGAQGLQARPHCFVPCLLTLGVPLSRPFIWNPHRSHLLGSVSKQAVDPVILWSGSIYHGLATSLLSSAFESWLVTEHEKSGFRQEWMNDTFWLISFGASVTAIGAGGLANYLVAKQSLGIAAPSFAAAIGAGLLTFSIFIFWEENPLPTHAKLSGTIRSTFLICYEKKVLFLGCAHTCLEFSITVFWYLWTPTLVADGRGVHSGLLFPCLMASEMLGSIISAMLLCGPWNLRPEDFLRWVYLSAAFSVMVPAYDYQEIGVLVSAFCVFHICYGIAWASLARLRSLYIPSEHRAALITIFQMPTHAVAVFILINGSIYQHLENSRIFAMSIVGLFLGGYCLHLLNRSRQQSSLEKFSTERP